MSDCLQLQITISMRNQATIHLKKTTTTERRSGRRSILLNLLALWPPIHSKTLPLNSLSYLTLHSSVCVHSPMTWISGCLLDTQSSHVLRCLLSLPSTARKNASTSSSSSGSHKAWGTKPWMVHSTHFPPPFSLPSLIVSRCPWKPAQSQVHTLLKCILHCCFYEHQVLCSEPSLLTQKGSVPGSSDTWEGAGMFSPKSTAVAFSNISM